MIEPATAPDQPPELAYREHYAIIRLQRPREHNRIDPDDVPVLQAHLAEIRQRGDLRAVVLTGTGEQTFCSGYTVHAIVDRLNHEFEDLLDTLENFPLPTLCALNGSVYGGATDLALCCDFRIGVKGSRMFMPAARFGLHYYPGGMRRYITHLGLAQTKRLFLTALTIDAEEMHRIGFLTELVERNQLASGIDSYMRAVEACEPLSVASMKRQLNAIAAGIPGAAIDRNPHEASKLSKELRSRMAAVSKR